MLLKFVINVIERQQIESTESAFCTKSQLNVFDELNPDYTYKITTHLT